MAKRKRRQESEPDDEQEVKPRGPFRGGTCSTCGVQRPPEHCVHEPGRGHYCMRCCWPVKWADGLEYISLASPGLIVEKS